MSERAWIRRPLPLAARAHAASTWPRRASAVAAPYSANGPSPESRSDHCTHSLTAHCSSSIGLFFSYYRKVRVDTKLATAVDISLPKILIPRTKRFSLPNSLTISNKIIIYYNVGTWMNIYIYLIIMGGTY